MSEFFGSITLLPGDAVTATAENGTKYLISAGHMVDGILHSRIESLPQRPIHPDDPDSYVLSEGAVTALAPDECQHNRDRISVDHRLGIFGKKPNGNFFSELTSTIVTIEYYAGQI